MLFIKTAVLTQRHTWTPISLPLNCMYSYPPQTPALCNKKQKSSQYIKTSPLHNNLNNSLNHNYRYACTYIIYKFNWNMYLLSLNNLNFWVVISQRLHIENKETNVLVFWNFWNEYLPVHVYPVHLKILTLQIQGRCQKLELMPDLLILPVWLKLQYSTIAHWKYKKRQHILLFYCFHII